MRLFVPIRRSRDKVERVGLHSPLRRQSDMHTSGPYQRASIDFPNGVSELSNSVLGALIWQSLALPIQTYLLQNTA